MDPNPRDIHEITLKAFTNRRYRLSALLWLPKSSHYS